MRRKDNTPISISEGTPNSLKGEKKPQNSCEASITDFSYPATVEWVLNDTDTRNRQSNAQGHDLMESLFLQIFSFIPEKRKRDKRRKTHQGSLDQETEAVSDAWLALCDNRASLRKLARKGRLLITRSPASPENCKEAAIETNWKQKAKAKAIRGLTKLKCNHYQAYMVKPHSHWMTLKYIINFAEKIVPALPDSLFLTQPKTKESQPTLLRKILNSCDVKEQI